MNDGPDEAQSVLAWGREVVVTAGSTRTVAPMSPSAGRGHRLGRNYRVSETRLILEANNEDG